MIARAPYLFLLLIIIPDVYLDLHYWRHRFGGWTTKRILYWMPTIGMIAYTLRLMYEKNFILPTIPPYYIYTSSCWASSSSPNGSICSVPSRDWASADYSTKRKTTATSSACVWCRCSGLSSSTAPPSGSRNWK